MGIGAQILKSKEASNESARKGWEEGKGSHEAVPIVLSPMQ